jgi:hypothetical protein
MGSLLGGGGGPVEGVGVSAQPALVGREGGGAYAPSPLSPAPLERGYRVLHALSS